MNGSFIASSVDSLYDFFWNSFKNINFDIIFWVGVCLMLAVVIAGTIRAIFSYENKAIRGITKVNKYLLQNPAITEENLVTFHNLLKKMPQKIRDRWQLYVLERDGLPSRYLTTEYCIRRPLANSALQSVKKQTIYATILICCLTFIFGLGYAFANVADEISISVLVYAFVPSAIIMLISFVFVMIIQLRISMVNTKVYEVFNSFVRNVNRAVATMPDGIDYEVLFTQKEIDEGIPILREYLEKKNLEEQQLLEASKYSAISHSPYNFDDLGVDGQQLISRAVTESESFIMKKLGLENEIAEFEKKLSQAESNMDDIEKEANRKLQTIKENLERLDKAISETTNRVEINYNRRQIKDEMEKKAAIEKDLKSLLAKEQVTVNECKTEIQKRRDLIEKDKDSVEIALKSEYNTFAVKVYDTLSDKVDEENVGIMKDYQSQIVELKTKIQTLNREIEDKNTLLDEKDLQISNYQDGVYSTNAQQQEQQYMQQDEEYAPNETEPNLMTENASQEYYDENGNLVDYSNMYDQNAENSQDAFYDENGNLIDYTAYDENGNYINQDASYENTLQDQNMQGIENEQAYEPQTYNEAQNFEQSQDFEQPQDQQNFEQEQNVEQVQTIENQEELNQENKEQPEELNQDEQALSNQFAYDENEYIGPEQTLSQTDAENLENASNENVEVAESLEQNNLLNLQQQNTLDNEETNESITLLPPMLSQNSEEQNSELNLLEQSENAPLLPLMLESEEKPKTKSKSKSKTASSKSKAKESKKAKDKKEQNKDGEKTSKKSNKTEEKSKTLNAEKSEKSTPKTSNKKAKAPAKEKAKTTAKEEASPVPENSTTVTEEKPKTQAEEKKKQTVKKKTQTTKAKKGKKAENEKAEKPKKTASKTTKSAKTEKKPEKAKEIEKTEDKDDFNKLQKKIEEETQKIQKEQDELRVQIDKALNKIENSSNKTKESNIKQIKTLIEKLKEQAKDAKVRGATKEEIKRINSSVADLVEAITKYSSKK